MNLVNYFAKAFILEERRKNFHTNLENNFTIKAWLTYPSNWECIKLRNMCLCGVTSYNWLQKDWVTFLSSDLHVSFKSFLYRASYTNFLLFTVQNCLTTILWTWNFEYDSLHKYLLFIFLSSTLFFYTFYTYFKHY